MRGSIAYPPLERHGLIGDRRTAALVAADGSIDWLCTPDYDDDPVFGGLIDARRGGTWKLGPALACFGRQQYIEDSAVLTTSWSNDEGALELTDAMPWPEERRAPGNENRRVVLRRLRSTRGTARAEVVFAPRDALAPDVRIDARDGGIVVHFLGRREPSALALWSSHPLTLDASGACAEARFLLRSGDTVWMVLAADERPDAWSRRQAEDLLAATLAHWRHWIKRFEASSPGPTTRRSLVTTHLLGYAPSGAMVAAPTLGLPERVGGARNYDYRFAWIRDASLSVASLCLLDDTDTAERYLQWLSRLGSSNQSPLQVAYDVHGEERRPLRPRRMRRADGYRGSRPVIFGNGAYAQRQLGSLGYVADCMTIASDHGMPWRDEYGALLGRLADYVAGSWHLADSGIWELRHHQHFVSSKVMAWVVLDRAAKIGRRKGGYDEQRIAGWEASAADLRSEVLARGYSDERGAFRQRYGAEALDASSLLVPLMGFLPAEDPRVLSTLDRIDETLGLQGFVYRFEPERSEGEDSRPLGEFEGAFLPCTFWMIAARAMAGQIDRAEDLLERVERGSGELGLFAEEVDVRSGQFLGNYPLLFSHVEHLRAVVALERAKRARQWPSDVVRSAAGR